MRDKRLQEIKRKSLEPQAMRLGFDYAEQYSGPEIRPAQRAVELLSCGFDLLLRFMGVDAFPSLEQRIRKRGAKLVRKNLLWTSSDAASFLTQAVPTLIMEMQETHDGSARTRQQDAQGGVCSRDHLLALRKLIADYFPLIKQAKELLEPCSAEFEVMRAHEPREEVAESRAVANPYSRALLQGEDPNDDPELVKEQREYARDYFINQAGLAVARIALYWDKGQISTFNRVEGRLVDIGTTDGPDVRRYRARALAALLEGMRSYEEHAPLEKQHLREIGLDSKGNSI